MARHVDNARDQACDGKSIKMTGGMHHGKIPTHEIRGVLFFLMIASSS